MSHCSLIYLYKYFTVEDNQPLPLIKSLIIISWATKIFKRLVKIIEIWSKVYFNTF